MFRQRRCHIMSQKKSRVWGGGRLNQAVVFTDTSAEVKLCISNKKLRFSCTLQELTNVPLLVDDFSNGKNNPNQFRVTARKNAPRSNADLLELLQISLKLFV